MEADSPIRRQSDRARRQDPARGLKPLRRKPKTLTEEPELRDISQGGGAGLVLGLPPGRRDRAGRNPSQRGGSGPAITEEQGTLVGVTEAAVAPDPETLRRAREIASRLAVPRPRRDRTARRGTGGVASVPYRGGSDDIDLDRTLERLVEHPELMEREPKARAAVPGLRSEGARNERLSDEGGNGGFSAPEASAGDTVIIVRERVTTTRSVVLLVDLSGSMRGERARTAAATVGALGAELARDNLGVIAFWSDAAVLSRLGQHVPPKRLVESMLRVPARGLTNIAFPLQAARRELARVPARDARVLLLSDCVHNAGPDPRPFAARLPRLDILLDTTGEQDPGLARDLARLGRGRLRPVRTYRDVAPALSEFFAS